MHKFATVVEAALRKAAAGGTCPTCGRPMAGASTGQPQNQQQTGYSPISNTAAQQTTAMTRQPQPRSNPVYIGDGTNPPSWYTSSSSQKPRWRDTNGRGKINGVAVSDIDWDGLQIADANTPIPTKPAAPATNRTVAVNTAAPVEKPFDPYDTSFSDGVDAFLGKKPKVGQV